MTHSDVLTQTAEKMRRRIKSRIAKIPAGGGGYISFSDETLRDKITDSLLDTISSEAAAEALAAIEAEQARVPEDREGLAKRLETEYVDGFTAQEAAAALRIPAPAEVEEMITEIASIGDIAGFPWRNIRERLIALLRRLSPATGAGEWRPTITRKVFPDGTIYLGPLDEETGSVADSWIEGHIVVDNDSRQRLLDMWLRLVAPRLDDPIADTEPRR